MTKRYDEPIDVSPHPAGAAPSAFAWRGRRYEIDRALGTWREAAFHERHGAPDREFLRVLARPAGTFATGDLDADGFMRTAGAVYDLCRTEAGWRLARVWD